MKYNWNIHDSGDPDDYCWYMETEFAFVSIFRNKDRTGFHAFIQANQHPIAMNYEAIESFEAAEDWAMDLLGMFIDECTKLRNMVKGEES